MKPVIYFPKGTPLSGKTTYINKTLMPKHNDLVVVSFDDHLEAYMKLVTGNDSLTYNECYDMYKMFNEDTRESFFNELEDKFKDAVTKKKDIVIDQTNLTLLSIARYIEYIDINVYRTVLIDFNIDLHTLLVRNRIREKEQNKFIPLDVLCDMYKTHKEDDVKKYFNWNEVVSVENGNI